MVNEHILARGHPRPHHTILIIAAWFATLKLDTCTQYHDRYVMVNA